MPADARLILASSVEVDESALTGESQPVAKAVDPVDADSGLAERTSMVHMNSALTRGRAEAVVTATGMGTAVGAIAEMLATGEEPKTPLQVQLDSLGKRLAVIGLTAVSIYCALALARGERDGALQQQAETSERDDGTSRAGVESHRALPSLRANPREGTGTGQTRHWKRA